MERLIDPVIADLQAEYAAALVSRSTWKSRWTLLVSYLAFAKVMLLCSIFGTRQAWRNWNVDDQRAFNRTLLWIVVATVVSSVVVGLPSLQHVPDMLSVNVNARIERLILYLVPSMLTFGVPAGLAIGAALGLSQRERSRRLLAAIGIVAVLSTSASLVNVAWVTPIANQSYREEVIGTSLRKGQNELTLAELRHSTGGTFVYHLRLAIGAAPLTFAIFGVVVATRRWRRAVATGMACAGVVAYLLAVGFFRSFTNLHDVMPARVAAWMPHILLAWTTILIARLVTASRPDLTRTRV